jgi:hypothetical protein
MTKRHLARVLLVVGMIAGASACSSREDFCRALPGVDAALSRVDTGLIDEPFVSVIDARESITLLIDRLTLLREAAPRAVRGGLGNLLAAYGQVAVAYEAVDWDPQVAAGDDGVTSARTALGSDDIVAAREELSAFATRECDVDVDPAKLGDFVVPTTLPLPSFSQEPAADAPDQGAAEDVLSAVGFVIAEAYRVAITIEQAACVGARAAVDEARLADATPEETHEWTVSVFAACGITTVPTTVSASVSASVSTSVTNTAP